MDGLGITEVLNSINNLSTFQVLSKRVELDKKRVYNQNEDEKHRKGPN